MMKTELERILYDTLKTLDDSLRGKGMTRNWRELMPLIEDALHKAETATDDEPDGSALQAETEKVCSDCKYLVEDCHCEDFTDA